jgi:hypothetical protein
MIDRLIIKSPYAEPEFHWCYEREKMEGYRGTPPISSVFSKCVIALY